MIFIRDERKVREYIEKYPISFSLIAINLFIFILPILNIDWLTWRTMIEFGGVKRTLDGSFEWYRILTSMFLHSSLLHIISNMLGLFIFGSVLEKILGKLEYLVFCLLSGILSSISIYSFTPVNEITVGASGIVFSVLGSLMIISIYSDKIIDKESRALLITVVSFNLVAMLLIPNISISGHIGGFVSGVVITMIFITKDRNNSFGNTKYK